MTEASTSRSTFAAGSELRWEFTAENCREPAIVRLYTYWLHCKGPHCFPGRQDIDPLGMKFALGGITLFDVCWADARPDSTPASRGAPRFRYRLIGSDIVARDGFDLTGRWLDELPLVQYRALMLSRLEMLVRTPRPLLVRNKQFYDRRWYDYEALWLPLAKDHETVDIIMACQIFADRPPNHVGLPVA
ncbi:MAG TPA: PAS domain-containing protein [Ferrovibrio sp.]|uniref:PAS domain-containing protein n=1 Tax=Ferrovibrio sp. TaxID=1917215 RepID=UPI002ED3EC02